MVTTLDRPIDTRTLMERIRDAYPCPISLELIPLDCKRPGHYCVGGALLLYLGIEGLLTIPAGWFPLPSEVAKALRHENPCLDPTRAMNFAMDLITLNEDQRYDAAWAKLEEALSYGH